MDNVKNIFDSFKEFIWDIIGYFLPGAYLIMLLALSIKTDYSLFPKVFSEQETRVPLFIIASYILGHVTYGMGWLKEDLLKGFSYTKQIERKIAERPAFKSAKQLLEKALILKQVQQSLSNATVRDVRNLVMSFIRDSDQKIYTFTFRSELANHICNISALISFVGFLTAIMPAHFPRIFITDGNHYIMYSCLLVVYVFARQTRNRFYSISVGIPFSIYTAKELNSNS